MEQKNSSLPENAYRELREGEEYVPLMKPQQTYREITPWSVFWGLLMTILFSAATAYLGLKIGQVFEAAIPITIIAVGISSATRRKNALGENVIIQSIGACSGMIVAGAIFTLPALYILQSVHPEITIDFVQIFLSSALGGILGILFLIPFRKYFVKDMHGKFPFPEATASTQVLLSGEKSGAQTKPLLIAGLIGGLYDFAVATFGAWSENFTSRVVGWGQVLADKAKLVFSINTSAALLGMGYIVGLKYAAIICIGSISIWWLIIPGLSLLFPDLVISEASAAGPALTAAAASPEELFNYAKSIGIGAIAAAGIIGVIKSWSVIRNAFSLMGKVLKGGKEEGSVPRTQRDLPIKIIGIGAAVTIILVALFFFFDVMDGNLLFTITGVLIVAIIAFLFTTVAANAIAIVGSNPVSGMTLMTLILSSIIMVLVGLKGTAGMVAALVMGGVVCTALSSAGAFVTDLKIGYWLGSTPQKQETLKFLGIFVSAATVAGVIMILNKAYGFTPTNSDVMAAPQARAMAAVIEPLMSGGGAPWALYGIGIVLAIVLNFCKVPALAFALGMFIPLQLNLPLLVGGFINWWISSRSKDAEVNKQRNEKGTLLASGLIAGGALMGVVSAGLQFGELNFANKAWLDSPASQLVSLVAYIALIAIFVAMALRTKRTK